MVQRGDGVSGKTVETGESGAVQSASGSGSTSSRRQFGKLAMLTDIKKEMAPATTTTTTTAGGGGGNGGTATSSTGPSRTSKMKFVPVLPGKRVKSEDTTGASKAISTAEGSTTPHGQRRPRQKDGESRARTRPAAKSTALPPVEVKVTPGAIPIPAFTPLPSNIKDTKLEEESKVNARPKLTRLTLSDVEVSDDDEDDDDEKDLDEVKVYDMDMPREGHPTDPISLPRQTESAPFSGIVSNGVKQENKVKVEPPEPGSLLDDSLRQGPTLDLDADAGRRVKTEMMEIDLSSPLVESTADRMQDTAVVTQAETQWQTPDHVSKVCPLVPGQVYLWQLPSFLPKKSVAPSSLGKSKSVHFTPTPSERGSHEPNDTEMNGLTPAALSAAASGPDHGSAQSRFTLKEDERDTGDKTVVDAAPLDKIKLQDKLGLDDETPSQEVKDGLKNWHALYEDPELSGRIGTLRVHRSGRMTVVLGDVSMDVFESSRNRFQENLAEIRTIPVADVVKTEAGDGRAGTNGISGSEQGVCNVVGGIASRMILVPQLESLLL